tara:strand:+ start:927 stop:6500 length:5574 start_codon:yes stop_codon:yes gene_type:complete
MATCYNRNTAEYKALEGVYKNSYTVDSIIRNWQSTVNDNTLPTIIEASDMVKDQKMLNSVNNQKTGELILKNLASKNLVRKIGSDYFIVSDTQTITDAKAKAELVRNYLKWNGFDTNSILFRSTRVPNMFRAAINENTIHRVTSNNDVDVAQGMPVLDHLIKMFPGTNYTVLNETDAKILYDQIPSKRKKDVQWNDINSFFYNNTAVLVKGRVTQETAIEEMLHPFVDSLSLDNAALFDRLANEAEKSFPNLKQEIDAGYSLSEFTANERKLELVTQALSKQFNKENETRPQISFLKAVKDFLTWFSDVVKSLYSALTGKKLTVAALNSSMSLSDVAKMLNTKDLSFELNPTVSNLDVRYSLNAQTKKTLAKVKDQVSTNVQTEILDQLFHQATAAKFNFESLNTARVIKKDGVFTNVDTQENYKSTQESIIGLSKNPFRNQDQPFEEDTEEFFNKLVLGVPYTNTKIDKKYKDTYNYMLSKLDGMRVDRSIFVPNVVVSDEVSGIASVIHLLKIDPFGNLQVINFEHGKTSYKGKGYETSKFPVGSESILKNDPNESVESITPKFENNLSLALVKRMLDNLGFATEHGALTIHLRDNKVEGNTLHDLSENSYHVDYTIPFDIDYDNQVIVDEIMDQMRNPEETTNWEDEIYTDENISLLEGSPLYDVLFRALQDFSAGLISAEEAIKNARNVVSMDKSRTGMIREMSMTRSLIENLALNPDDIVTVYIDIVRDSIKQIEEFQDYIGDPENFGKKEYISKVLSWQKFVEKYRGLVDLKGESSGLNATQLSYISKLQSKLNEIVGVTRSDKTIAVKGQIDLAIDNYVRATVKEKSNYDWSDEQLDEIMTSARDIGYVEYQTGDMATSRDTISALMDKIYKRDRQIVLDRVARRAPRIKRAALKLAQLSPTNKIDYNFMLQMVDGEVNGRYIQQIGSQFYAALRESKEGLTDEQGAWKSYIEITDLTKATPEQIKYNQDLWAAKQKHNNFKKAEIITDGGPIDGNYFKYSEDYKRARSRFEIFVPNGNGGGFWSPKQGKNNKAWLRYVSKYHNTYNKEDNIYRAITDVNDVPTGQVELIEHMSVVKKEYVDIKPVATDPKTGRSIDMQSDKWKKLQNPQTDLEKAQSEYYNMFVDIYENELINMLPDNIKMIGKVPVIQGRTTDSLKDKPNVVGSLYSRMKTKVKNWFSPSTVIKKAFSDEHGNIITDSLPIFYTGSLVDAKQIEAAHIELQGFENQYTQAKTNAEQQKLKKKIKEVRGKIKNLEAKPSAASLNLDMTESLLKFSAMAENYEVMSQSEDTYTAMIRVLGNRSYTDWKGNTKVIDDNEEEVGVSGKSVNQMESNIQRRAMKWMKMVYYNNDADTKTFFDKLTKGIITGTSLAYVGFNIFGNLNNYVFGRVSNAIETAGGRFFRPEAMMRAIGRLNTVGMVGNMKGIASMTESHKRFKDNGSRDKYNAWVMYLNMLDSKEDMRESQYKSDNKSVRGTFKDMFTEKDSGSIIQFAGTAFDKFHELGYLVQDAGEYNVQTKIGHAIVESTTLKNSKTGETLSLYDAYDWDNLSSSMKIKEGFDKVIFYNQTKEREWNADARYELRNYIREVNKQVHGNYAHEDRMVMQSTAVGQLAAQFHKWVAPSIKTRFRPEYFDENLGWMEGRYLSFWNFMAYNFKNISEIGKLSSNYKAFNGENGKLRLQNAYRTLGEIGILMTTFALKVILSNMFEDDDDEEYDYNRAMDESDSDSVHAKRLRNVLLYQLDRTHKDLITFVPIPGLGGLQQMYQMFKSPIASTRTMGELGQALETTVGTGLAYAFMDEEKFMKSKYVYQRTNRKGQWKLGKEWGDALPILYTINRYKSYDNIKDFFIK